MQKKFDANFAAFVKGSKTPDGYKAYGLVIRAGGEYDTFYSCSYVCRNEGDASKIETTSTRMEYEAIVKAASIVAQGKSIIIYTNNETAVRVFNGEWKAKKHRDLLKEMERWKEGREVGVRLALYQDDWQEYVDDGMIAAELMCRIAVEDARNGKVKTLPSTRFR